MDFISNGVFWTFVGACGALGAVIVPIVIYLKQKNIKGLVRDVISNTSLLSIDKEVKGKIQVLYNGKPVDDVRQVVLKLWNYRQATIEPKDYVLPIVFDFGDKAEILDTPFIDTIPPDLKKEVDLTASSNTLTLKPVLLHGKDSVTIKVILTKFDKLEVSARINGVRQGIITVEELPSKKRIRAIEQYTEFSLRFSGISTFASLLLLFSFILINYLLNIPFDKLTDYHSYIEYYPPIISTLAYIMIKALAFYSVAGVAISIISYFVKICLRILVGLFQRFDE
jgi:hypothetical protein